MTLNPYRLIWRADPVRIALPSHNSAELSRLRSALPRTALSRLGTDGCRGYVGHDTVVLRHYRAFYRNDMSPVLDARLRAEPGGTFLEGVYRMSQYGRVFMTVWFTFLLILLPFFVIAGLSEVTTGRLEGLLFVMTPALMIAFGIGFLRWGQSDWDLDKRRIEAFVTTRLQ